MKFLSTNTTESSTRLFTLIIIASTTLSILAVIITFIILLFKGKSELSEITNIVISLGSIAIAALTGKIISTNKERE
jgi:glucan phosphoethanolaminetransferase (alkaline phosphatase superfamily)